MMIQRAAFIPVLLWCLACSSSPRESSDSLQTEREEPEIQAYASEVPRVSTRILFMRVTDPPSSPGELAINYGQPKWKPQYEEKFDELTRGKRWRFGNNLWTTLDTNIAFTLSGTPVSPGQYYLTLRRSPRMEPYLELLDADLIRSQKLDAFFVDEAAGGLEIPLRWTRSEETAETLEVKLIPVEGDLSQSRLEIHWGKHLLTAPIQMLEELQ